jgi:hypothetical protein
MLLKEVRIIVCSVLGPSFIVLQDLFKSCQICRMQYMALSVHLFLLDTDHTVHSVVQSLEPLLIGHWPQLFSRFILLLLALAISLIESREIMIHVVVFIIIRMVDTFTLVAHYYHRQDDGEEQKRR